jgi:hypothetical protein
MPAYRLVDWCAGSKLRGPQVLLGPSRALSGRGRSRMVWPHNRVTFWPQETV